MAIITLTTDWGRMDYYVGALKGELLNGCPTATIVDISHHIPPFNVQQAAFVVRNSYQHFPKGTVHIIGVNSEPTAKNPLVAVQADGQYFLGADTGVFSLSIRTNPDKVIRLSYEPISGFSALHVFGSAATHLANGGAIDELGEPYTSIAQMIPLRAAFEDSLINGTIIYIDSFNNVITNISNDLFERVGQNRAFEIYVQSFHNKLTTICNTYSDALPGELLAIFNSVGLLEVAIHNGKAAELLSLDIGSAVRVKFLNNVIN
ncbi:MAG TPA: SAM-dependent chlorinase/fluorinase [Williamwhitmania sp.]|nr:SAM-dependent chlorinase/fluorinase [Williamwhitmania sp.]